VFFWRVRELPPYLKKPRLDGREFCRTFSFAIRADIQARTPSQRMGRSGSDQDAAQALFHADHNTTKPLRMCIDT
jgi:hypothetical protein